MERAALLAALLLSACAAPRAPATADPPRSDGALSQLVFYDYRTPADPKGSFSMRFDDGSGPRFVKSEELRPREFGFPSSTRYDTRASGSLRVSVRFEGSGRSGSGSVELPLRPDWIWGVSLHVTARDPREGCMGCLGVRSFPLSGAPAGEQLHLVWGGNSISAPAVY
ncbi:MAG TPA: hypothetical protein VF727_00385 [Allosphingosinicella sp.]